MVDYTSDLLECVLPSFYALFPLIKLFVGHEYNFNKYSTHQNDSLDPRLCNEYTSRISISNTTYEINLEKVFYSFRGYRRKY